MSSQQISCIDGAGKFMTNDGSGVMWKDTYWPHSQTIPSTIWTVNHNLNKNPSVTTQDNSENLITGVVKYIDLNNLTITFLTAKSGNAYLN